MNQEDELQRYVDTAMRVLTPVVSQDLKLATEMWDETLWETPAALLQGLMLASCWLLGELDKAGVDRHECLQQFAVKASGQFAGF
ncbi:Uncharacterised protein [Mycobacteroides abscessus subsp. abscessus]|nr:Uncharacterised protein [Mycobacteroides abscessus subsp. abscessus]